MRLCSRAVACIAQRRVDLDELGVDALDPTISAVVIVEVQPYTRAENCLKIGSLAPMLPRRPFPLIANPADHDAGVSMSRWLAGDVGAVSASLAALTYSPKVASNRS